MPPDISLTPPKKVVDKMKIYGRMISNICSIYKYYYARENRPRIREHASKG